MRYHLIPIRMTIIKNITITTAEPLPSRYEALGLIASTKKEKRKKKIAGKSVEKRTGGVA
jgi:hypothetical protein